MSLIILFHFRFQVGFSAEWYNSKIGKFEILRKNLVFNGDNERE
jgi:hypothetical protein